MKNLSMHITESFQVNENRSMNYEQFKKDAEKHSSHWTDYMTAGQYISYLIEANYKNDWEDTANATIKAAKDLFDATKTPSSSALKELKYMVMGDCAAVDEDPKAELYAEKLSKGYIEYIKNNAGHFDKTNPDYVYAYEFWCMEYLF